MSLVEFVVHPAAELFPLLRAPEFNALVADIREHGLMEPIVLDVDGNLIDGRNRARACEQLGIVPECKVYEGDDVWQYVVSQNLHRRHLSDSQRAMIAAQIADLPKHLHRPDTPDGVSAPPTRSEVKDAMQVSEGSLHRAKTILRDGIPELGQLADAIDAQLALLADDIEPGSPEWDALREGHERMRAEVEAILGGDAA